MIVGPLGGPTSPRRVAWASSRGPSDQIRTAWAIASVPGAPTLPPSDTRSYMRVVIATAHPCPTSPSRSPSGTAGYEDLAPRAVLITWESQNVHAAGFTTVVRSNEKPGRDKDIRVLPVLRRFLRDHPEPPPHRTADASP